jgi:hypothetical protein
MISPVRKNETGWSQKPPENKQNYENSCYCTGQKIAHYYIFFSSCFAFITLSRWTLQFHFAEPVASVFLVNINRFNVILLQ